MDSENFQKLAFLLFGIAFSFGGPLAYKLFQDARAAREARTRVLEAEKEAFKSIPESFVQKTEELRRSHASLEQQALELSGLIERNQNALRVGTLFDLYGKQIEKYQTETQARAGWSFIFAIIAMFAGLGFVVWGGVQILVVKDWQHIAAGSAISAIGGAVSAYITKTFLDVHRLSLNQLNRYFRQPVINAHILTAQRLADHLELSSAKQAAYESIIANVTSLIREDNLETDGATSAPLTARAATANSRRNRSRRAESVEPARSSAGADGDAGPRESS